MTTPTETPRTEQLKIQLRLEQADAHSILLAYERIERQLTAATAQLASVLEDRARFPDKPDDVGRMIEAHMENLKALAARHEQNWRDKEIENCALKAQLEEARRDKERLDWLDGSGICDAGTVWARAKGLKYSQCSSLRDAIDAAMQQKEGK